MSIRKHIPLIIVLALIAGSISYIEFRKPMVAAPQEIQLPGGLASSTAAIGSGTSSPERAAIIAAKAKKYPRAIELANPSGFINADPFKLADLVGKKVILVDFWTYSCINCQRTLPYLTAWDAAYRDKGLAIVGIETPEFDFEKNKDNVKAAMERFGIKYPVVQDNDHGTWEAYQNLYWPHKYLIDIDGFIVYDHIGEGSYDVTEQEIQKLLAERDVRLGVTAPPMNSLVSDKVAGILVGDVGSPETYFGAQRNEFLANGAQGSLGAQTLIAPDTQTMNALYLGGTWDFQNEFAENRSSGAKVIYNYHAKNVYFVGEADTPVKIRVLRDGKDVDAEKGSDVMSGAGGSFVTIKESRLYNIIKEQDYGDHTLELIIESPGVRAYTFTFG